MSFKSFIVLFFIFNASCVSPRYPHYRLDSSVIKVSKNKTMVVKYKPIVTTLNPEEAKKYGLYDNPYKANKIGERKYKKVIYNMCNKFGDNLYPVVIAEERKNKSYPMYQQFGISCKDGNCSGGGGYSYLSKDSWWEVMIQCNEADSYLNGKIPPYPPGGFSVKNWKEEKEKGIRQANIENVAWWFIGTMPVVGILLLAIIVP